jgi:hypothetical protein
MHAAPKKDIKVFELDEVTDVISDSSQTSEKPLNRISEPNKAIKSIRETALNNFNKVKVLNKSSKIKPTIGGYKTHAFVHLT